MEVFRGEPRSVNLRACGSFKDGTFIRRVEIDRKWNNKQCLVLIRDVENNILHTADLETAGLGNFITISINIELSSFDGRVCLVLGGFFDGGNAESVIVKLDYYAAPEVQWKQLPLQV